MKIGIQGDIGSACDAAAAALVGQGKATVFKYLVDAERTVGALTDGSIDAAVMALESPVGTAVEETKIALANMPQLRLTKEFLSEVRHCIMVRDPSQPVTTIASHEIPLRKHRAFLSERFPGYAALALADTGLAAAKLAAGELPEGTAVIALPYAARTFNLKILEQDMPANDKYLTKFVLVQV